MCYMKCPFENNRGECRRVWHNLRSEVCPHNLDEGETAPIFWRGRWRVMDADGRVSNAEN